MTGFLSRQTYSKARLDPIATVRDSGSFITDRLDAMYELQWRNALDVSFETMGVQRRVLGLDRSGCVSWDIRHEMVSTGVRDGQMYTPLAIRIMATLIQFHHATTRQLTVLIERPWYLIDATMTQLYRGGVVRRGRATWGDGLDDVWNARVTSPEFATWLSGLRAIDRLLIEGTGDATKGSSSGGPASIRHNLMGVEMWIRAMEYIPEIVGAWGEHPCDAREFLTESEMHSTQMRWNIGDVAFVARNGDVIVLEITSAKSLYGPDGDKLIGKMAAWGAIAALSDVPLKAVFVNTTPEKNWFQKRRFYILKTATERIGTYLSSTSLRRKAAMSIFGVHGAEWFPTPRAVDVSFRTLQSWNVTSKKFHDLIDVDCGWSTGPAVVNTVAALHTPSWSIDRDREQLPV